MASPVVTFSLLLFAGLITLISISALRNRIIFRMGVRNILRRKGNTAIVISGLMIGTAIISSSFVIGDTMNNFIDSAVLDIFFKVDEIVTVTNFQGQSIYFDQEISENISIYLLDEPVDGVVGEILENSAILDTTTQLSEPAVQLAGITFDQQDAFGGLIDTSGSRISFIPLNQAALTIGLADDLDASVGDDAEIFVFGESYSVEIFAILKEEERATSANVFVSVETAQLITGQPGLINRILISNNEGIRSGMDHTDVVLEALETFDIGNPTITLDTQLNKKAILEQFQDEIGSFADLFLVFGSFSIIAGVILIINIFVMLAAERKPELGMARAVGMKRVHLSRMFLYEGNFYAMFAALGGTFLGVGIGYLIMAYMNRIFGGADLADRFDILQFFTFTPDSLILAFIAGYLLTITTIFFASSRLGRLNIVRAVRDIPEPPPASKDLRFLIIGAVLLGIGSLAILGGVRSERLGLFLPGISLILIGIGLLLRRLVSDQIALNFVGAAVLVQWLIPFDFWPDYSGDIEMFILSGVFLIFAASILLIVNSKSFTKLLMLIFRFGRSSQAVVRAAISYSLYSKFRTGMTISMFGLILFTITTLNVLVGIFGSNIESQIEGQSGGFDIFVVTGDNNPIPDFESALMNSNVSLDPIQSIHAPTTGNIILTDTRDPGNTQIARILGIDEEFTKANKFSLAERSSEYSSDNEAWRALNQNDSFVIVDAFFRESDFGPPSDFTFNLGDEINTTSSLNVTIPLKIIGFTDSFVVRGVFRDINAVESDFNLKGSSYIFLALKPGEDTDAISKSIEKEFLAYGAQTILIKEQIIAMLEQQRQFFNLFNAYLGLGLVVGIAGLGIITVRAVHERRQQIGMLRAIGFERSMILKLFLIEGAFISVFGIMMGVILGIFLGYNIWLDAFEELGFEFVIPWGSLSLSVIVAFLATLLCTVPPSYMASRVDPAEALRYE